MNSKEVAKLFLNEDVHTKLMSLSIKDMHNRLEYLSQWGEAIS